MLKIIERFNFFLSNHQDANNSGFAIQAIPAMLENTAAHPNNRTIIESAHEDVVQ